MEVDEFDHDNLDAMPLEDLISLGQWAAGELLSPPISDKITGQCLAVERSFFRRGLNELWQKIWNGESVE